MSGWKFERLIILNATSPLDKFKNKSNIFKIDSNLDQMPLQRIQNSFDILSFPGSSQRYDATFGTSSTWK